jgi:hypothetical protein
LGPSAGEGANAQLAGLCTILLDIREGLWDNGVKQSEMKNIRLGSLKIKSESRNRVTGKGLRWNRPAVESYTGLLPIKIRVIRRLEQWQKNCLNPL